MRPARISSMISGMLLIVMGFGKGAVIGPAHGGLRRTSRPGTAGRARIVPQGAGQGTRFFRSRYLNSPGVRGDNVGVSPDRGEWAATAMAKTPEEQGNRKRWLGRIGLAIGLLAMLVAIAGVLWFLMDARRNAAVTAQIETAAAHVTEVEKACAAETAVQRDTPTRDAETVPAVQSPSCANVAQARQEHQSVLADQKDSASHRRTALITILIAGAIAVAAWFYALR